MTPQPAGEQSISSCFCSLSGIARDGRGVEALSWLGGNGFVIVALEEKYAMTIKQNHDQMNGVHNGHMVSSGKCVMWIDLDKLTRSFA